MAIKGVNDIVIRPATNADTDNVMTLVSGVLTEFNLPFEPEFKDSDLEDIEQSYLRPGGMFELLEARKGNLFAAYGLFPLTIRTPASAENVFCSLDSGCGTGMACPGASRR